MNLAQEVINHDYPANILLHLENLEFHFMVKCSLRAPTIKWRWRVGGLIAPAPLTPRTQLLEPSNYEKD